MHTRKRAIGSLLSHRQVQVQSDGCGGMTFTELLVVIATLGILAMVILPAVANPQSKAVQCMSNMRELALAWTLYAGENAERLAINSDPHVINSTVFNGTQSYVAGSLDWSSGQYNTNTSYLIDDRHSLLGSYCNRNPGIFACPSANYVSQPQHGQGWNQRARSVAMNGAVGDGHKYLEPANPFFWNQWYVARKMSDFQTPRPSQSWVFMDEHPDSIDDAVLYTPSYPITQFTELPAALHEGAAGITFADGHVEMHKWTGRIANIPVKIMTQQRVTCYITDPDMLWEAQHTPRAQ
jgi:prepilin-type processing-associated H-X9-DG protein